jgi:hypothetical protein
MVSGETVGSGEEVAVGGGVSVAGTGVDDGEGEAGSVGVASWAE